MILKLCGIQSQNIIKSEEPFECNLPFNLRLHMTGYEPKIFHLDKSSYGNIETICKVLNKSITKAMPGKDTIFNFELKYPQVIINAPQCTKYRLN